MVDGGVDGRLEDGRVGGRTDAKRLLHRRRPLNHHRQLGVLSSIGACRLESLLQATIETIATIKHKNAEILVALLQN